MNQRIRELAEQAGYYIDPDFDIEFEVFVRLIVRECASKVDWILAEDGQTQGDLIKQYFGVE